MPTVQAPAGQRPLLGAEAVDQLQQPLEGGPAGELVDGGALGPGDDERLADRPAALRHHGGDGGALDQDADGAVVHQVAVEHEAVAPRPPRRRRHAAEDAEVRVVAPELGEEGVDGERERVGQQEQGAGAVGGGVVEAGHHPAVEGLLGAEAHRCQLTAEAGGEQRHPRLVLHAPGAAQDGVGRGADEHARVQEVLDGPGDVLQRPGVGCGHEEAGEVGLGAELLEDLADDLPHGGGGDGVLGEGRGEVHRHTGGRRVRGTGCHGPRSIRQRARMGP